MYVTPKPFFDLKPAFKSRLVNPDSYDPDSYADSYESHTSLVYLLVRMSLVYLLVPHIGLTDTVGR